jgi:hypothetical protein
METIKFSRAIIISIAFISVATLSIFLSTSISPVVTRNPTNMGNDEKEFVFSGTCDNGQTYRLLSYEKVINGQTFSQYDYEGPVGKGTVKTSASPRTLSVRVCRQMAEIIDDH